MSLPDLTGRADVDDLLTVSRTTRSLITARLRQR
jgi:hypothetical protein